MYILRDILMVLCLVVEPYISGGPNRSHFRNWFIMCEREVLLPTTPTHTLAHFYVYPPILSPVVLKAFKCRQPDDTSIYLPRRSAP